MGCFISSRRKKPATKGSPENRSRFHRTPLSETIIADNDYDRAPKVTKPPLKVSDKLSPKELKREESVVVINTHPRSPELANSGWPLWLISLAGEALIGWIPRRESDFKKQEQIGGGTFSKVYKAQDLLRNKTVALKRIRFDLDDSESIKCIAREITILRKLDHPNVIKLEGLMLVEQDSSSLYLIFEYMEHDLLKLSSLLGSKFSEPQVKCYMRQLLQGLDHCHTNHVLHRDIKSSNLLINRNGVLKIADFGLSTFFDPLNSVPLTTHVVTLWYRPPELLLGASHYGVGIDLWSTGCVIGELYAGKPILPGKTEKEQLHKIFELCGSPSEDYVTKLKIQLQTPLRPMFTYGSNISERFKEFPTPVISLLETLLSIDPDLRGTAASALDNEYFTTVPLACDPSCLPKYSPRTSKQASQVRQTDEPRDSSHTKLVQKEYSDSKSSSDNSSYTKSYEEDGTSCSRDHSAKEDETGAEVSCTESSNNSYTNSYKEDETSSSRDHSARQMQTITEDETGAEVSCTESNDNSYTNSHDEDGTSSSKDHSARQMQSAKDLTTEDETGAYTDSSREEQNRRGSMKMETNLPTVYENGTFSSVRVGIIAHST